MSGHCQDLVARADKDRYLSCLFAPPDARPHLFALFAFNVEIARIRESVSEPQIGLIRQQWWLDAIDGIYACRTPDHPWRWAWPALLQRATCPYMRCATSSLPVNLISMTTHAHTRRSRRLSRRNLFLSYSDGGTDPGQGAAEAAGFAGVAYGLAGVLRLQQARYLPKDMVQNLGEKQTIVSYAPMHASASRQPVHCCRNSGIGLASFSSRKPDRTLPCTVGTGRNS